MRNLGATIAPELAAEGASVAVDYGSSEEEVSLVVSSLHRADGARHASVRGDVTKATVIMPIAKSASEGLDSPFDILLDAVGPRQVHESHDELRTVSPGRRRWGGSRHIATLPGPSPRSAARDSDAVAGVTVSAGGGLR